MACEGWPEEGKKLAQKVDDFIVNFKGSCVGAGSAEASSSKAAISEALPRELLQMVLGLQTKLAQLTQVLQGIKAGLGKTQGKVAQLSQNFGQFAQHMQRAM